LLKSLFAERIRGVNLAQVRAGPLPCNRGKKEWGNENAYQGERLRKFLSSKPGDAGHEEKKTGEWGRNK